MDKVERLMTLMATLLDTTRPLPVDEVRARMGGYYAEGDVAFHRAFERDKEDLREMGIPISVDRNPFADPPTDGYWIRRDDYYLRDPGLEPDELAALNVALSAIQLDGVQGLETLWKLGGAVEISQAPAGLEAATLPSEPALVELFGAVLDRATVSFDYRAERREVDPFRIDFRRGHWYLVGSDRSAGELRTFRLDRFESPVVAGRAGSFRPPDEPVISTIGEPWKFGDGETRRAELWVDDDQATLARQYLGHDTEVARDERGATFEVEVTNWPAVRSFVLTLLDHAELRGPADLRADLVSWLGAMADGETRSGGR